VSRLLLAPTVGPSLGLVMAVSFFAVKSDRFFVANNASLILQQVMVVGVLAVGQTLVILTAGIDLSNGAVMALGQIVMTKLATQAGAPPLLALAMGVLTCAAFGLLNGTLVTRIRLPPFIVTLGTLNIAFALTHIYSGDESFAGLPDALTFLGRTFTVGATELTYGVVAMLAVFGVTWYALTQTAWGRHVYAVGDSPGAARLSGIHTDRLLLGVYTLAGFVYGVAAVLLVARTEVGDPNAGLTSAAEAASSGRFSAP